MQAVLGRVWASEVMSLLSGVLAPFALLRPAVRTLHAPDGFFSLQVIAVTWAISAPAIYVSLRRAGQTSDRTHGPGVGRHGSVHICGADV